MQGRRHDYRRRYRKHGSRRKLKKRLLTLFSALIIIICIGTVSFGLLRSSGRNRLKNNSAMLAPVMTGDNVSPVGDQGKAADGRIIVDGQFYDYNKEIITFLIMGIDKDEKDLKKEAEGIKEEADGGQADGLFLLVFNSHTKKTQVIAVNRNTMTNVDIYDDDGNYVTSREAQIAVQHGFGDGREKSCEYQRTAVSKLFYNLPIHGYAALNMTAIKELNDAVGSVSIVADSDFTTDNYTFRKGQTYNLDGQMAYEYVTDRDVNAFGSADERLSREKIYLSAFIEKVRAIVKEKPQAAADLFSLVKEQMTTDITMDEVTYLTPIVSDYSFDISDILTLSGTTQMGEEFEEFYPDEKKKQSLVLDVFYEKNE